MRSRAELALRVLALALLGWCLASAVTGRRSAVSEDTVGGRRSAVGAATVRAALEADPSRQLTAWSRDANLAALAVVMRAAPDRVTRDWLRALDRAGTRVTWSGEIPALAIAADAVPDPRGGTRVQLGAAGALVLEVHDAAGRIDSVATADGGATVVVPSTVGRIAATTGAVTASSAPPPRRVLRDVVVLGRAGWEAKFVTAALEEQGWRVIARMPIAPRLEAGPDAIAFDTSRVAAVVALDSTAARDAGAIVRFVRSGGGVVIGPDAAGLPAFAALAAGRAEPPLTTVASYAGVMTPVTRQTLPIAPIVALRPDAVPLERRDGHVALAARRVEAGRVMQLGYGETWRWRMAGGEGAPEAHRRWWSQLVSAVAYAPAAVGGRSSAVGDDAEVAPRAALVAALGEPSPLTAVAPDAEPFDPSRSLLVYLAIASLLLAEWASRRLRGVK